MQLTIKALSQRLLRKPPDGPMAILSATSSCNRYKAKSTWALVSLLNLPTLLTSCKNFEICRIDSVVTIIYGFQLCFSAFLLSGGQASECPHLASCSSRAQLRSQF